MSKGEFRMCVGCLFLPFSSILLIHLYLINNIRNPGEFAKLSGASRRKMNIESDIVRPKDQQCNIVEAVPKNERGFNDWTGFFEPLCPRDASPP